MGKSCSRCNNYFDINIENFRLIHNKYYYNICRNCINKRNRDLGKKNYSKEDRKDRYNKNKPEYLQKCKEYRKNNIECVREKDRLRKRKPGAIPKPRKVISHFRLRSVSQYLKNKIENRHLPYSINKLRKHLEAQFESWMNWNNLGEYSASKWDDNDSRTWKWQVDHIIPYADLPYTSSSDENFKKLWSLDNLRPLSAKINCIDGARRVRHKSEKKVRVVYEYKKPEIPQEEIQEVKRLYIKGLGAIGIAKEMNISRYRVQNIYKIIDYKNITRDKIPDITSKICKRCNKELELSYFRNKKHSSNGKYYYEAICKECEYEYNKIRSKRRYQKKGRDEFQEMYSDPDLRREWLDKNKKYRDDNKERLKEYRKERLNKDRENLCNWQNTKREEPIFKLRSIVSNSVNRAIKRTGNYKKGSILDNLPYSIKELKEHLEAQFESWMTWENHGKYWDDNDESTWKWQIDHIVPHSDLPYDSMKHPNFKKCWVLDNLRSYSAKKNLEEGAGRIRHKAA